LLLEPIFWQWLHAFAFNGSVDITVCPSYRSFLFPQIDFIIHAAAAVNMVYPYQVGLNGYVMRSIFFILKSLPIDELGNWCQERLVGAHASIRHSREVSMATL